MTNDVSISDLESQLALAKERLSTALAGRIHPDADAAWETVASAQRALAAAKGEEYAVPYGIGFEPEAAVSEGLLLQTEHTAILTFRAVRRKPDGIREDAGYGIVELDGCQITKFGYPNDEALPGHPLSERGLDGGDGVYEVKNSSWTTMITIQNRVRFPNTPDSTCRHFVFTFHDSTFECVARGLSASLSTKPYAEVFEDIRRRVFRS